MSLTLEAIAERVIWWKPPAQALADRRDCLARVMTAGTFDEVRCVRSHFPAEAFRAVLEDPPAGVFDPRSWGYWNLVFDRDARSFLGGVCLPSPPRVALHERVRTIRCSNDEQGGRPDLNDETSAVTMRPAKDHWSAHSPRPVDTTDGSTTP